jgi:hypothetical protein
MTYYPFESEIPKLVMRVSRRVPPEILRKACVLAGERLRYGFDSQSTRQGNHTKFYVNFYRTGCSWPFQLIIQNNAESTDRIEVWTGRVFNESVVSALVRFEERVSECLEGMLSK